jgi:steroid 5-alpha reductase family enzyme
MEVTQLLVNNALLLVGVMFVLWIVAVRIRDVTFIDSFWAMGMMMLAASTYLQTDGSEPRKFVLLMLTSIWASRLGAHLLVRWMSEGLDSRYKKILNTAMERRGWSYAKASLLLVFVTQAPLLFIVCLPAQLGQIASEPVALGWLAYTGIVVAVIGIGFETIGDLQLRSFRSDPRNAGKVLDTGLWRYTRHPNYFGDACTWWGIWLVAAETSIGFWTLPGPVLLTWTLMRWSGVPLLEYGMKKRRPGYEDYIKRTSGFFPLPPKKTQP